MCAESFNSRENRGVAAPFDLNTPLPASARLYDDKGPSSTGPTAYESVPGPYRVKSDRHFCSETMTPEGSRSSSPSPPLEIHRTRSRSVSVNAPPSATGGVASASATTRTTKAHEPKLKDGAVGRMDATFYRRMMPGWRCDIREALVKSLEREIDELVQLQVSCILTPRARSPTEPFDTF